jgi:murein DD-endopeptidase MepM/ murein hydrolase activator NlpD
MHRFVISPRELRYLVLGGMTLLCAGAWLFSDYVAVQRKQVEEVIAKARAQQAKLSGLQEKTREVQETLASWKQMRGKIQVSLPRRSRHSADGQHEGEELENVLAILQGELKQMIASLPFDWPVEGRVVSGFGMRPSPWTGEIEFHGGLDIPRPIGTPVRAAGDAVVESIDSKRGSIVLNHGQEIKTQYGHLSKIFVTAGDRVRKGQAIAEVGNTGKSTGPHLHYEVRVNGNPVDPRGTLLKVNAGE